VQWCVRGRVASAARPREADRRQSGLKTALIGIAKRSNGTEQVTYNGHPLYMFIQDTAAGQTTGQGLTAFGAHWYVLAAAGDAITTKRSSSSTPSTDSSGGSGAYGY
jgi:Secreted repeat of unknown function